MLEVKDLAVSYGSIEAVKGVSFEVGEGEVVGIIGANGAGKTTVLNTVAGVLQPVRGTIRFKGSEIHGWAPEAVARAGISLVPEGRRIFSSMTVRENLRLATNARADRDGFDSDLANVLELLPVLERLLDQYAGRLSGGEQQQLAIARALLCDPSLLMLDEPSLGLAPQIVDKVFEVIEELRSRGVTILLVEQNAHRTLEMVDKAYVLRIGLISDSGTGRHLLENADVVAEYLGVSE